MSKTPPPSDGGANAPASPAFPAPDAAPADEAQAESLMRDPVWRLNNLYRVVDRAGRDVPFRMNPAQLEVACDIFRKNKRRLLVLKARQLGFSTLFELMALDTVLWSANRQASICADTDDNAKKLLRSKVFFAYDALAQQLRGHVPTTVRREASIQFGNGGAVHSSTRVRGGTNQFLHISELGKISHRDPARALEILTGAFPSVPTGGVIAVESTFEGGRRGIFYDLIKNAMETPETQKTALDFHFKFFDWFDEPGYRLDAPHVPLEEATERYFLELQTRTARAFERPQKVWWQKQRRLLGSAMNKEFPSTPEEAFEVPIEGSIYGDIISRLRAKGRIADFEWDRSLPVHAFWDIGFSDATAIWFVQFAGREVHFVDFYENAGEPGSHYAREILARPYGAPACYLPHDAAATEKGSGLSYRDQLERAGLSRCTVLPRTPDRWIGINALRDLLERAWFHKTNCARGLECLEAYHKRAHERTGSWSDEPVHDWSSNAADAARYVAEALSANLVRESASPRRLAPDAQRAAITSLRRR